MLTITPDEISQFRIQFVDHPEALVTLDAIEECKGNLEAATQLIAVETTEEEVSLRADSSYLEKLAQKLSEIICQEEFDELMTEVLTTAITDELNEQGIKNKRGGKWQAVQVSRVINREVA